MPSRKRVLILTAVAALVLAALWLAFSPRGEGPIVNKRPLSHWVEELGRTRNITEPRPSAASAILDCGTNAMPYLLLWIQSEAKGWRDRLPGRVYEFMSEHPNLANLPVPRSELRVLGAGYALLVFTNLPALAIQTLMSLVTNPAAPQTASRAFTILTHQGDQAIPAFITVLQNPTSQLRHEAAFLLSNRDYGPTSAAAVPALIQCLNDPTPRLPFLAALALGKIKASPELTVPALLACLQNPDPGLRSSALHSLASFPAQAAQICPAITNLLNDPDEHIRIAATNVQARLLQLTNSPAR